MGTTIHSVNERTQNEASVLRRLIEDDTARHNLPTSDIFEHSKHRELFDELRRNRFDIGSISQSLSETLADVLGAEQLNGSLSIVVERLALHRFDVETFPATETGNAERFQQQHGKRARYDHDRGCWMLWDGIAWQEASGGEAVEIMTKTARTIYDEAAATKDDERRRALAKWASQSESRKIISNSLELAQSLPSIRITSDRFDSDPLLFNTRTHTLNLRTMQAEQHDHRNYCSKLADVKYSPVARCDWWENEFLPRVFNDDRDMIFFVQQSCGYSLTGLTDLERLFFAYGTGANGKSTFFEVLKMLFGDYYGKAPADLLLVKRDGIPLDVAMLQGKRFVVCSEIEQGRRLNEAKMKDLTGGDTVTARRLYQLPFHFTPSHKLFLYGNHKPVVSGQDLGVWRRMLLIPFMVTIPESEREEKSVLLARARVELSGILNWCLEGLTAYKAKRGLVVPPSVKLATERYQDESDSLAAFIGDCTQPTGEVPTGELYKTFVGWSGDTRLTSRMFIQALTDKGYSLRVGHGRKRFWQNLSVLED